jgi:hypothetical protein
MSSPAASCSSHALIQLRACSEPNPGRPGPVRKARVLPPAANRHFPFVAGSTVLASAAPFVLGLLEGEAEEPTPRGLEMFRVSWNQKQPPGSQGAAGLRSARQVPRFLT